MPAQWSDEQLEVVTAEVDRLLLAPDVAPDAPVAAPEAPPVDSASTTAEPAPKPSRAVQVAAEAGVDPAKVIADDEKRATLRDEAVQVADSLSGQALSDTLAAVDPDDDGKGSDQAKRKRLIDAMVAEGMREAGPDGALPLG